MPKQIKIGINQICFEIVNKGVGQLPREGYQRLPQLVIKAHKYKYTYQIDINNEGQQRSQKSQITNQIYTQIYKLNNI